MANIDDHCELSVYNKTREKHIANYVLSCVKNGSLIGVPSNSASPTDQWLVEFEPNTLYTYENTSLDITNGFMKIFVTNPLLSDFANVQKDALNQEIKLYKSIQSIMQRQINGHFVRYLISVNESETLDMDNMYNFLNDKIDKVKVRKQQIDLSNNGLLPPKTVIDDDYINEIITTNFYRNVASIFVSMNKDFFSRFNINNSIGLSAIYARQLLDIINNKTRPAIQHYDSYYLQILPILKTLESDKGQIFNETYFNETYFKNNIRFGFVVTESVKTDDKFPYSFNSLPSNYSCKLDTLIKELKYHAQNNKEKYINNAKKEQIVEELITIILTVYFQVATACYSLFVNGISHNDLHTGNIWVKNLSQSEEIYYKLTFDALKTSYYYQVNSNKFAMIYDWDRSYKKWNRNPMIEGMAGKKSNQTNDSIEQRDFVKSLCYFMKTIMFLLAQNQVEIDNKKPPLISDNIAKILNTTYLKILLIITKDIEDYKNFYEYLKKINFQDDDIKNLNSGSKNSGLNMSGYFWHNIFMSNKGSCFLNYDLQSGDKTGYLSKDIYNITLESMPVIINNWHAQFIQGNRLDKIPENKRAFKIDESVSVKGEIVRKIFNTSTISNIDKEINLYQTFDLKTLFKTRLLSSMKSVKSKASEMISSMYRSLLSVKTQLSKIEEEKKEEEQSLEDFYGL